MLLAAGRPVACFVSAPACCLGRLVMRVADHGRSHCPGTPVDNSDTKDPQRHTQACTPPPADASYRVAGEAGSGSQSRPPARACSRFAACATCRHAVPARPACPPLVWLVDLTSSHAPRAPDTWTAMNRALASLFARLPGQPGPEHLQLACRQLWERRISNSAACSSTSEPRDPLAGVHFGEGGQGERGAGIERTRG
jgi:hypothetical protein